MPTATDACEAQIRDYLTRNILFTGDFPYDDDASLLEEGIVDSMGVMEVVAFVQSEFGINVQPADVTRANFDSISRLAAYIRRNSVS